MAGQQVQRRFIGQLPSFQVDQRVQHLKLRGMLPKVAAHPGFPQLMPVPAIAPDKDRDLARMMRGRGDHVRGNAPDLQVVEPQVILPNPLPEVVQQRKAGNTLCIQPDHGFRHLWMRDRRGRNGIHSARHPLHQLGEIFRRLRGRKGHLQRRANPDGLRHGPLSLDLELLVEGLTLLVQDQTQPQAGLVRMNALPDQRCSVIADQAGCLVDLAGGLLAHLLAPVQNAVHCGA